MLFNCILLIFFALLNILLPFIISFLILGKKGVWYKYFVFISALFYLMGIISISIIEFIENSGNEFTSIFFCDYFDKKYSLGLFIANYQFSMMYFYLIPLSIGMIFWLINIFRKSIKENWILLFWKFNFIILKQIFTFQNLRNIFLWNAILLRFIENR